MIRRELSMTPVAIRARERRFNHWLKREEDKFKAEVKTRMVRALLDKEVI